jgi:hypothetical protein
MRRLIVLSIYIAAAVLIGYAAYFFLGGSKVNPEQVLPAGPLIYFNVKDLNEDLARFQETEFWQKLNKVDPKVLLPKKLKGGTKETDIAENWEILNDFLGEEFSIALYSPEISPESLVPRSGDEMGRLTDAVLNKVYLVSRVKPFQKIAENFSGFFARFGKDVTLTTDKYLSYSLRNVLIKDINLSFSFVKVGDLLVVGASNDELRKCIDIYEGESETDPLIDDPDFVDFVERVDTSESYGFINMGKMYDFVRLEPNYIDKLKHWKGINIVGFSFDWDAYLRTGVSFFMEMAEVDADLRSFYNCPSGENNTLKMVPEDVMIYQWGNCFKADKIFSQIKAASKGSFDYKLSDYKDRIGVDVERDIVSNIGDEIAWYIEDVNLQFMFPVPQALLMVDIKKNSTMPETLKKVLADMPFRIVESDYSGVNISSISSPVGDVFNPSYCFIGDFLLIATNQKSLEKAIDVSKNKSMGILKAANMADFNEVMTGPLRGLQIADFNKVGQKMTGVIKWANGFVSAREKSYDAFVSGAEIKSQEINERFEKLNREKEGLIQKRDQLDENIYAQSLTSDEISALKKELADVKAQLEALEKDLSVIEEQKISMEKLVGQYHGSAGPTKEQRLSWERSFFAPLSEALKEIETYISWSAWDEQDSVLDAEIYMKINEQ